MLSHKSTRRAVATLALAGAGLMIALWLIRRPASTPTVQPDADSAPPATAATARQLPSLPRGPEPAGAPDASATDASRDAGASSVPYRSWLSVLIERENQNYRDVDEFLFNYFQLSEPTRDAVRQVNEDYSRRIEALARSPSGVGNKTRHDRDRQLALGRVLGPRTGAFINAEFREMKRLRQIYHRQFLNKPARQ